MAPNSQAQLTLSAIASRLEASCAGGTPVGLRSMLDSFKTVSRDLPTNTIDHMSLRISRDASALPKTDVRTSDWPEHFMELKMGTDSESVSVSIHTCSERSFQLHFRDGNWKPRRIQVKRILFQTSPIDAVALNTLQDSPLSKQASIEQEMNHLSKSATSTIRKVCGAVAFDDVTTVTGYLAEAVLRVVRPMTKGLIFERVSMDVVIGDDSVTLTRAVSLADIRTRADMSSGHKTRTDDVSSLSGYQANVSHLQPRISP